MRVDVAMEQAFLGSVLTGEGQNDHLLATLQPGDFTDDACRRVFVEMNAARLRGNRLDARMVASIAGPQREGFVGLLVESVATPLNADEYARRLSELAGLRLLAQVNGVSIAAKAESLEHGVGEMRQQLAAVEAGRSRERMVTTDECAKEYYKTLLDQGEEQGCRTGIHPLDLVLGRLQAAALYIIAARPGVGKTALMTTIAEHVAIAEKARVAMFSLEMTRLQLTQRMVSSLGRIDHAKLKARALDEHDWPRAYKAASQLSGARMLIHDKGGLTVSSLHAAAKTEHLREPLSLVVVDYLQLVHGSRRKGENREQEVAEVARGLKMLAMDLGVPVIAGAQLNRDVEKRGDKRPMLADLRESGEIEQSADVVIMLHREWMTDRERPPEEAELLVRKNRHGEQGEMRLKFLGQFCRFEAAL
jgi:replicative DNA helicase